MKLSAPAKPLLGWYVTTLPTTETIVPFAGAVTTALLVAVPVICAVRSMAVAVENPTETDRAATVGADGNTVMLTAGDGNETPPGPVAVYVKLAGPE